MFVIRLLASAFTALTLSAAEGVIRVGESSVDIDIHLPVTGNAFERVLGANRYLNEQLRNSEVDFVHTDVPHVTLYLTSFSCPKNSTVGTGGSRTSDDLQSGLTATNCIELISNAVNSTVHSLAQSFGPCDVYITNSFAAGSFAMANVSLSPCLQTYSDAVVNATYQFIQSNQTVPSWVHDLPEPERSEKIALVQEYGSPNVFSQFQPHVTLAWSNDTEAVAAAVAALKLDIDFPADTLAMGSVGDHGTVLKGKDLAIFDF